MNDTIPARILGGATAAYGVLVTLRPEILLRPTGIGDGTEPELRALARMIALRDLASGLALALASTPKARTLAAAVRIASDVADTTVFARALPAGPERTKTLAVTTLWGLLTTAAAAYEHRDAVRGSGAAAPVASRP